MEDQSHNKSANIVIEKFQVDTGFMAKPLSNPLIPALEDKIQLPPEPIAQIPNPFEEKPVFPPLPKIPGLTVQPVITIPGLVLKQPEEGMLRKERPRK